jgi:hypothetical protein
MNITEGKKMAQSDHAQPAQVPEPDWIVNPGVAQPDKD